MNTPQWIKRLLNVEYVPTKHIDSKELDILNRLDSYLTANSTAVPPDSVMALSTAKISLFLSMKPVNSIVSAALLQLPNEFAYIPRSIAFFVDEQGNRCFVVAFRGNSNITGLEAALFSQMLAITNNERSM